MVLNGLKLMISCGFGVKLAKQEFMMMFMPSGLVDNDEQIMVDDDESSSVQPASSNISSNVGKGPQQQPSIYCGRQ